MFIYNIYVNIYAHESALGTETMYYSMTPSPGFEQISQCDLQDLSLSSVCFEAEQNNSCDPFCFQAVSQTWEHYEWF